tara:strand:- start:39380 stop:42571 length:3192 start_codon:yes stop_codon:yes gene_type:complete
MWQINRITKDTLLNISKYSNKVIKLAKYFQESNQPFVMQELLNMSDQTDQVELLESFDKDITKTVNELFEIQKLLITVDDEGNIKELKNDNKNLKSIFNENYDLENQKVKFPSAVLDLKNPKAKKDLKKEIIENILELSPEQYKQLMKIKDTLKDVDKEELSTDNEKINYLVNKSNIDFVKESVEKINQYVKAFVEIRKNLNFEEKELIDKKITSSRTMIDGVLNDSTFISLKDNIEQISPIHLRDNDNAEKTIEEIKKELEESKYINSIEIDKDTDLEKFLFLLKKVKGLNLNLTQEFEFKTRKLGNYRANGLYLHDNELLVEQKGYHNTEYNIVSLDVNSPSSMIYELTNLVGLSNEEFIKSPVRRAIALHFKSKVNSNILQENGLSTHYLSYLRDTKKVMARLGEIGYILNKYDYKGHENKDDLMSFFDKVRLMEQMEHKGEKEIPIVHKIDFYRKNSAQYFDLDNLHEEELKIIKEHFKSYYNTINNEFLPLENTSMLRTLNRLKEDQKLKEIQREILEEEENEDKPKATKRRYNQEENPVSKITLDNIDSILEYNDKEKIFTEKELCTVLSENIYHLSRRKYSLTMGEVENKLKVFEKIMDHGIATNNDKLQQEVINSLILKKDRTSHVEMEKLLNKENGSLRRLHVFINDVSWNNKMKIERMVNKKLEDLLKKINPNFKPIEQNFNLHINIDKEEEEKSLTNNLEFLKQFDKDSLYLHQALLEITNKFHKIGADVKNVLNTDKIKERNNNFFEENSDAFKTELFKMSEKIDKVIEEYAVEKMRKVIEVKSKREGDVGYNYNAHWLSVDMSHFSDDFLIKNFKNIVDEDNKNSNEENLKLIKEIRFDNLDKEEVKIIFKNINLEDLNQNSLGEIAQQGYISGFPPVTNRLNRISLENKFEDKEVSVELISNIANTYRNEYIRAKNIGFEDIDKTKLFTTTMSKAKESFEENIEYRHRVSNYNLEREPEKISFLRNLNKKVIQFLEEKDLLKDYIDNYKRIKINGEETFNYRGNKVSVTQKLEGLLYMQGVDIDASNAFEKLKEEIKTKNGNIKGNKIK